ncbi:efflux RND transporter periplasmic adaptor subunit [Methylobacillus gramineus]|uniref:efflux RND transporter periplasmic adaptor subunit n=1 Tax=Methylobacillus gramineus TaxID=755169 RepID=UPI001CFFB8D6|nr:efflux RND transporter periplasmic adaptor subunit [Methylobacillus gramineus]MCB5185747.1 efflux RND transporter periplasmic adaptor subunit [Methylobacillus gramineus]
MAARRFGWLSWALLLAVVLICAWLWWNGRASHAFETEQVKRGDIEYNVTAIGTLQPRSYVDVGAQVSGQILALHAQPGDAVQKGQLLAEIDPRVPQATVDAGRGALAGLQAQLEEQEAQYELASQQQERQQQMQADGSTRTEEVQQAQAALKTALARIKNLKAQIEQTQSTLQGNEALLGFTKIYAPMAGTVISIEAKAGQTLNATYQTPTLLRIADLSTMTVWTDVSEADVRHVKPGMQVYFKTLGGDLRRWNSTVRQVLPAPPKPEGQTASATQATSGNKVVLYTVLFDVDNRDGELMPQMTAQASFIVAAAHQTITVPVAALTEVDAKTSQYKVQVLTDQGKTVWREVKVGVRNRLRAEVQSGLNEGEQLVTAIKASKPSPWRFQF